MKIKVQERGNSLALRIPRPLAAGANVVAGTTVDIELREGRLTAEHTPAPQYELDGLVAGIETANLHAEATTGERVGREIW